MDQYNETGVVMVLKTSPPALATVWAFWGFTLNEWAAIFAIVYSVLGIVFLLVDRFKKWRSDCSLEKNTVYVSKRVNYVKRAFVSIKRKFNREPSK